MTLHSVTLLLHLLGAGVIIGVGFFSVILTLRSPLDQGKVETVKHIRFYGTLTIGLLIATGVILAFLKGPELLSSTRFWLKMSLIVIDGMLAQLVIKQKLDRAIAGNQTGQQSLPLWTSLSATVILLIVTLGFITTYNS